MCEIWKDIREYEGLYQVSNKGRVRSLIFKNNKVTINREKILKTNKCAKVGKKREYVDLYKNGKRKKFTVHRLVLNAFIPNTNNKKEVNHIDGNTLNNKIENLEWVTSKENMKHAYINDLMPNVKKRNEENKKCIERDDGKIYDCAYSAAKDLNVSVCSIRDVLKGRIRTCKGYKFKYLFK